MTETESWGIIIRENGKFFAVWNYIIMTEKKKKILHVLASNKFSGAENVACTIIRNMSDDFEMAYCSPKGPIEKKLKEMGIRHIGIEKLNYKNLKQVISKYKPDIIHAHDYRASLVASRFSKRCKIISHIHLDNPKMRTLGLWSILYQFVTPRFQKIIWVSEDALKNYYYKKSKNVTSKSIVLRNVVDTKYIKKRATEGKEEDSFDLIFLGRLSEQKNPMRAIDIVQLVKKQKEDVKLAVVGDGGKRDEIRDVIIKYGLQKNVTVFGFQENPYLILNNSKILLMTSNFEGTPMAILEAQALDKPVVSTKIKGFEELINNGVNGFLTNSNETMAKKIVDFLQADVYLKLSESTREIFRKNNDALGYFKTIMQVYEK